MNSASEEAPSHLSEIGPHALVSSDRSLTKRTALGALWLGGARLWSQALNLTVGVALARLLSPEDYGLLGMVTVVTGLFAMLSNMGLSAAVVQKQDLAPDELSSIFWLNLGVAAVISCGLAVCSPIIAHFYSQPKVVPVMCVMVLALPISALSSVQYGLVQKQMKFKQITKIYVASSLAAGILALLAAWAGWRVWALVVQTLTSASLGVAGLWWKSRWRPSFHFVRRDLGRIWGFSSHLTAFSLVNYFARNADNFLVGGFLGPSQLGFYNLAYSLMLYPLSNLTGVVQGALGPAMSQVQSETRRLASAYVRTCRYLAFLVLPMMVGLGLVAREAVSAVYGPKWDDAGRVLQILAWVGAFQPFDSLTGTIFVARGLTRWIFWSGLISTIITVMGFIFGLPWGLIGIAWGYAISQAFLALVVLPIQYRRVEVSLGRLLKGMALPGLASACMAIAVLIVKLTLKSHVAISPASKLAACVPTGVLSYAAVLLLFRKYFWSEFRTEFGRIFHKG